MHTEKRKRPTHRQSHLSCSPSNASKCAPSPPPPLSHLLLSHTPLRGVLRAVCEVRAHSRQQTSSRCRLHLSCCSLGNGPVCCDHTAKQARPTRSEAQHAQGGSLLSCRAVLLYCCVRDITTSCPATPEKRRWHCCPRKIKPNVSGWLGSRCVAAVCCPYCCCMIKIHTANSRTAPP